MPEGECASERAISIKNIDKYQFDSTRDKNG
jgi:hypothetical protein